MGFFSGIRRRIKKLIPKEVRPALPFILAATPLAGLSGPLAGIQSAALRKAIVAGAAKGLSDDEAGIKDVLRTSALAAAPDAISGGLGRAGDAAIKAGLPKTDGTFLLETGKMLKGGSDAVKGLGALKTVGAQAATDFGIKQAELNEKAIEEYNASLLSQGMKDKGARRSAIFSIFVNNGYDEDEVNVMLDKYGYADGGRVKYANGKLVDMDDVILASMKGKKRTGKKTYLDEEGGDKSMTTLEEIAENARDKKDLEDEGFDASEFSENLQAGISGLEKAFGQPLGGRRPEPMRIIPGFAEGGDVDEVMEFDEEIITPEYLMKEEGVEIGEQVSSPNAMDELNSLSLDMFGRPVFELSEEEFEMLKDFASQQALKPGLIDEYRNYKYQMEEQGITPMSPRDYFRNEFGAARLGVKKGGKVIKIMPEGVLYKGKAKDYPGIKQLIKDMKKKGTRNKKADGGSVKDFEEFMRKKQQEDKMRSKERLMEDFKQYMNRKKPVEAKEGGLMNLAGNEMDLRGGGFVPMGKKERADDVPARLSKNEFVMTADAVRAAGGGSVQKGADLMYDTMKKLEAQS